MKKQIAIVLVIALILSNNNSAFGMLGMRTTGKNICLAGTFYSTMIMTAVNTYCLGRNAGFEANMTDTMGSCGYIPGTTTGHLIGHSIIECVLAYGGFKLCKAIAHVIRNQ